MNIVIVDDDIVVSGALKTILEASGDSYQDYDNRVSAMTGLSTVLGWYVHE